MDFEEIPVDTIFTLENDLSANHRFVKVHSANGFNALNLTTMHLASIIGKVRVLQKCIVLKDVPATNQKN
jgi:hypothetical protein